MLARNSSQPYRRVSVSQDLGVRVYRTSDCQNQRHPVLCRQGIVGTIHIEAIHPACGIRSTQWAGSYLLTRHLVLRRFNTLSSLVPTVSSIVVCAEPFHLEFESHKAIFRDEILRRSFRSALWDFDRQDS